MCGIVGYIGKSIQTKKIVECLKRLEYRGYDSAGLVARDEDKEYQIKSVGNIDKLEEKIQNNLKLNLAIAHTRWATHGEVSEKNCHPHYSVDKSWCVVHNGIIENYLKIKKLLKNNPESDTDTAIISQFLEDKKCNNIESFVKVFNKFEGSYAVVAMNKNKQTLFIAKNKSPLYVANVGDGIYISSDPVCFNDKTNEYYEMQDKEFAEIKNNEITFFDNSGCIIKKTLKNIDKNIKNITKIKEKHFMLKEIFQQKQTIKNLLQRYKEEQLLENVDFNYIKNIKQVVFLGCGTAYHACLIGKMYFEDILKIPSRAEVSSEFIYQESNLLDDKTLIIAVSQSGETADTLAAIDVCTKLKLKTLAITNVEYSTITNKVDLFLPVCSGEEKAVASTKAYSGQLVVLYMLACHLANIKFNNKNDYFVELEKFSKNIMKFDKKVINDIAKEIQNANNVMFIGKLFDYVTALEAGLKLKEVSYLNTSTHYAGELKHGYLALIDKNSPLFVIVTDDKIRHKTLNSAIEAQSRGAKVYVVSNKKCELKNAKNIKINSNNIYLMPICAIIPLQYLAYQVSVLKGLNPDQPRNLAKSVTVE